MSLDTIIIKPYDLKQSILTTLADNEMKQILDATTHTIKSINDIIIETRIPRTSAYRKINWMHEQGLLGVMKIIITDDGKKMNLFQSTLKSISINYENTQVTVEAEKNTDVMRRVAQKFFSSDVIDYPKTISSMKSRRLYQ